MTDSNPLCGTDWGRLLQAEFGKRYWSELMRFIDEERAAHHVYPAANEVFRALQLTWCQDARVVIVGQDPYHGAGQACGLAFSVACGVPRSQSLVRIHAELKTDVGVDIPPHGSLEAWAHRGVLLLNKTLTVCEDEPLSHKGNGWESFTDRVLVEVGEQRDPVFLLLGKEAQGAARGAEAPIANSANVVQAPRPIHPTFLGSKPFSRVNARLRELEREEMDWSLQP